MFGSKQRTTGYPIAILLALLFSLSGKAGAERLPIRYYTTEDGLANNRVTRIVRDSQGFLWVGTTDGLSRFDGQRFTTFKPEEGLISSFNDFLETRSGEFWAATNGSGVCRFNYTPRSPASEIKTEGLFTVYPVGDTMLTNSVNVLREAANAQLDAQSGVVFTSASLRPFLVEKSLAYTACRLFFKDQKCMKSRQNYNLQNHCSK